MKIARLFAHSVLLFTVPSLALHPTESAVHSQLIDYSFSYDELLSLLDELESGELEKRCSLKDLEHINHYLANLAKQGINGEDTIALEQDIHELLSDFSYSFSYGGDVIAIPAVFYGGGQFIQCKGWVHKRWNHTKHFFHKHKKAIIIGAAVVATAAIAICAVAAISAASAAEAAAVAGAAGAAASASNHEKKHETIDVPVVQEALEVQIDSFKEQIAENPDDPNFVEKARELGSLLAHETLDAISELGSVAPHIAEEINDLGARATPESLHPDHLASPKETYEKVFTTAHRKVDEVFSTDFANRYTPEAKAERAEIVTATLPPPTQLPLESIDIRGLSDVGKLHDRGGLTSAGRSLQKKR